MTILTKWEHNRQTRQRPIRKAHEQAVEEEAEDKEEDEKPTGTAAGHD